MADRTRNYWLLTFDSPQGARAFTLFVANNPKVAYAAIDYAQPSAYLEMRNPIRRRSLERRFAGRLTRLEAKVAAERDTARDSINFTREVGVFHPGGRGRRTDLAPFAPRVPG